VDKLMLSALEATLHLHRDRELALGRIPLLQMLSQTEEQLRHRARSLRRRLAKAVPELTCEVVATVSFVGGGSAPTNELPSYAVAVSAPGRPLNTLAAALRVGEPSVFPRIENDRLLLDLRTIRSGEETAVVSALAQQSQEGPA